MEFGSVLKRSLVLVAHADDETVGYGALLRRMESPVVAFATDSAPRAEKFWKQWRSREEYAAVRRRETLAALELANIREAEFADGIADQELYLNLDRAYDWARTIAERVGPETILTLAYEGGHPDHDSCSVIAAVLGAKLNIPVWETPLYHRFDGKFTQQEFLSPTGEEVRYELSAEEVRLKRAMIAAHASQQATISDFPLAAELLRPQPRYDFTRPPHEGEVNYRAWGWPVTPADLSAAFVAFIAAQTGGSAAA